MSLSRSFSIVVNQPLRLFTLCGVFVSVVAFGFIFDRCEQALTVVFDFILPVCSSVNLINQKRFCATTERILIQCENHDVNCVNLRTYSHQEEAQAKAKISKNKRKRAKNKPQTSKKI